MQMIAVQTIIYDVYLARTGTAISVQFMSVRWWDWSNTVQNVDGMVSLHGAIVKITENRVIVNVYLQELCYILLVMNLWGITKEDLYIEAQERGKNFALIIKSSLFEGIFIDAKGVNCASLWGRVDDSSFFEYLSPFCFFVNWISL